VTTTDNPADRALEAALAWARAERESNKLWAIAKSDKTDEFGESTKTALHDACVREDIADETLREVARALLEETCEIPPGAEPATPDDLGVAGSGGTPTPTGV